MRKYSILRVLEATIEAVSEDDAFRISCGLPDEEFTQVEEQIEEIT